jgi:EAL domain-containing protein (putative c-di-GMP-specific phosphodiesterase class I)
MAIGGGQIPSSMVIAEGVETEEQRQVLLNNGRSNVHRHLFSKPVPIGQLESYFKED